MSTICPGYASFLNTANQRYLHVQQDILATYVDRGQLQELRRPNTSLNGRRVPGMRVDDPRLIAVLHAITCFAYLVGKGCFRTRQLLPDVQRALGNPNYRLSQLRYDLGKLRSKGFIQRLCKPIAFCKPIQQLATKFREAWQEGEIALPLLGR